MLLTRLQRIFQALTFSIEPTYTLIAHSDPESALNRDMGSFLLDRYELYYVDTKH